MNKGVVMEKHRKFMVVITESGDFQKATPIEHAQIGDEVVFEPVFIKTNKSTFLKLSNVPLRMLLAACMFIAVAGTTYFAMDKKDKTYAYVHIDINPSIELKVDKRLAVQGYKPLNEDAKKLFKLIDIEEGEGIDTVIQNIMEKSVQNGLDKNGKHMFVGVSYLNDSDKTVSVVKHINKIAKERGNDWEISTFEVPEKILHLAKKENKSMIRLIAMDAESTTDFELSKELMRKVVTKEEQEMIHSFYYPKEKEIKKEQLIDDPKNEKVHEEKKSERKIKENAKEPFDPAPKKKKEQLTNNKVIKQNQDQTEQPSQPKVQQEKPKSQSVNSTPTQESINNSSNRNTSTKEKQINQERESNKQVKKDSNNEYQNKNQYNNGYQNNYNQGNQNNYKYKQENEYYNEKKYHNYNKDKDDEDDDDDDD